MKYVEVCPGYFLHRKIHSKLFPYQRKAIEWMYSLFKRKKGGILGDDMGLGKTVQVISFLAGESEFPCLTVATKLFSVTGTALFSWKSLTEDDALICRTFRHGQNLVGAAGHAGVLDRELDERV